MDIKPTAFTLRNEQLINTLITPVRVSVAHTSDEKQDLSSFVEYKALWDTGATYTVITKKIIDRLNLQPITQGVSYHAQGSTIVNIYNIDLVLPNGILVQKIRVSEGILTGCDMLIGMDIINLGDFALTHKDGKTVFSFQIPATHEYDFVKQIQNQNIPQKKNKRR